MKRVVVLICSVVVLLSLSACLTPNMGTAEQRREAVLRMHDDALAQLYAQRPAAEDIISKSAGYAVFSNVNAQFFIVGSGGGFGVAVDQTSGQKTYMRMAQIDLGLGLGLHDVRVVFVFHSERSLNNFVSRGWEFTGQADMVAKARDKGSSATGEISIDAETSMYTLSEAGLIAKVNLAGTKYWKDEGLNN